MEKQIYKGIHPHVGTKDAGNYISKKRKKVDLSKLKRISQRARELDEKYKYEDFCPIREF